MEIQRDAYIQRIENRRHNGMVKVVTGIRRCGKSYLLFNLFRDRLRSEGVDEAHIITAQLDDWANRELRHPDSLYEFVKGKIEDDRMYYVLLDEIQLVPQFEDLLNGFLHIPNADIYVTGSNARFLSKDVITEFRGRGDEVRLFPLTFREYMSAADSSPEAAFEAYMTYGGLPHILALKDEEQKASYLKNLFTETYLKDIKGRYGIRKDDDLSELLNILASGIGGLTNPAKLTNTFESVKKVKITDDTVRKYLEYICDSFLMERAEQYDVKGKRYINSPSKYYFIDTGLRNARLNFRQDEKPHLMENIIYNELRARGYNVDVGVVPVRRTDADGNRGIARYEVDFVCNQGSKRYYIQSAFRMDTDEKMAQEKMSLLHIGDSFKKIIIVGTPSLVRRDDKGITTMNILDFLLNDRSLEL